ncbi:DUF2075 domain-containing protein [uncultured Limosilactobacillus sp.]|uniref:DUF2075 domain-containing protein n=1 Tax=uncultured Limosilactobacillus sp. TaxID=2837629 RepID=UPI0025F3B002|nr:DUF2075 domain-containing protein [uncultured Limosilactobacillus sp.]
MSKNIPSPIIYHTKYNRETALNLDQQIQESVHDPQNTKYLVNYPTVYIINEAGTHQKAKYTVYVGETNDIQRRTIQHLDTDPTSRSDWRQLRQTPNALMYVIGHQYFNKSLTLDIENRMMHYLSGVSTVNHLNNRRDNAQSDYYKSDEMIPIFNKIWTKLHRLKPDLFPIQRIIEESALFKASPFHKLTQAQLVAKKEILKVVEQALRSNQTGQLILVKGEAGAGKTVLMSNIFYDLANENNQQLSVTMMVNHPQQQKVYEQIVSKLSMADNAQVQKVPTFINRHSPEHPVDIAFVDEAHLLLTKRSQAYYGHGTNELLDIIKRARVTIAVYDENQVLSSTQVIEDRDRQAIEQRVNYKVTLKHQMRIDASPQMVEWLHQLVDHQVIGKAPRDPKYDLRLFDDPAKMQQAIQDKASQDGDNGISRMLATFDWPYSGMSTNGDQLWEVSEEQWHMPWNLQLKPRKSDKHKIAGVKYSDLSWSEQPHTVNEIGSTYTIQGSDLNYAGVIIGPSVKYRHHQIVFDPSASKDAKAVQRRTMHDGSKKAFGEQLIKNEFNVLMTRGVHGLYLHAVDPALQQALKEAIE